jgi:hypothetical protein
MISLIDKGGVLRRRVSAPQPAERRLRRPFKPGSGISMGLSFAATGRLSGPHRIREACSASRSSVYTSVADLLALRAAARTFSPAPRHLVESLLSAGRLRDETGPAGEWPEPARAAHSVESARPGDRERPALFIVDQRRNMFFGSRRSMKSVAAAEAAALCAWRALDRRSAVGGVVFNDATIETLEPDCSAAAAIRFIETISAQNAALRACSTKPCAPSQLDAALKAAAGLAPRNHLVVVVSDFHGHGRRTRELLIRLAARNDVLAILVYDPFLLDLPAGGDIIISGGEVQVDFDFGGGRIRRSLFEFAEARGKAILAFEREIGVPVLALSAAEETAPQMRRLLDRRASPKV